MTTARVSLHLTLHLCLLLLAATASAAVSAPPCERRPGQRVYAPTEGELLVALGDTILKVRDRGGTGDSMFEGSWRIGNQRFPSAVTAVAFVQGHTLIGLHDGRLLKIRGTGGTGANMFAIQPTSGGFQTVPGYSYLVGSHRFRSGIQGIFPAGAETYVAFRDGKLLKIRGSGGTGYNLFAINESHSSFTGVPGYDYYVGDQRFSSPIVNVAYEPDGRVSLVSLRDGKILKVRGTGGTGHNMFAIQEHREHFSTLPGYDYYLGDQKFARCATASLVSSQESLIGFQDGRVLKVRGTGGTGRYMFNVRAASYGFEVYDSSFTDYLVGSQNFGRSVTNLERAGDELLVTVWGRAMLKIAGTGGTGGNMFNVEWRGGRYRRSSASSGNYLLSQDRSRGNVVTITPLADITFLVNEYSEVLKVEGTGRIGPAMLGPFEQWCRPTSPVVGCCKGCT